MNSAPTHALAAGRTYLALASSLGKMGARQWRTQASRVPFKAHGLRPAVISLAQIMADVNKLQPDVYRLLHSRGMLVCRFVRPAKGKPVPPPEKRSISNHSWGCAIDLAIGTGKNALDARGNNRVQHGLNLIAPIFNQHGWYWGAAFDTEDAMHFEVGLDLLTSWLGGLA